jgi:hypothetical protein
MSAYHVCALAQRLAGAIQYFDGTFETNRNLGDPEEYRVLKRNLKREMNMEDTDGTITILSLTRLSAT